MSKRACRRPSRVLTAVAATGLAVLTACSSAAGADAGSGGAGAGAGAGTASAGMGPMSTGSMSMGPMASSQASTASTIVVKNFSFTPANVTVPVGTTITWVFDDAAQHTVTASDKSFSSPALHNGQTYRHTFTKPGTYHYICSIHQYMTGTITVK